jgi:taurine dioxygenase
MDVRHSTAPLGAEITGIDLAQPLASGVFQAIERLLHDRGVIVIRDQILTPQQHISFSRLFGDLEIHVARQYLLPGHPEILVVSNIIENGSNIGLADAGQYWHSDLSYVACPSRCSLLYAREVPVHQGRVLGETWFASAFHALDTLPGSWKDRLEQATAVHRYADRYKKQQNAGGRGALSEDQLKKVPDVAHPVIRAHPLTGRKVLFVNEGFTAYIEGMPEDQSASLLHDIFTHIVRPETLYKHQWRQGDLLIWDNCLVQHRAIRDYALPLRRLMHRTTVAGVRT